MRPSIERPVSVQAASRGGGADGDRLPGAVAAQLVLHVLDQGADLAHGLADALLVGLEGAGPEAQRLGLVFDLGDVGGVVVGGHGGETAGAALSSPAAARRCRRWRRSSGRPASPRSTGSSGCSRRRRRRARRGSPCAPRLPTPPPRASAGTCRGSGAARRAPTARAAPG